MAISSSAPSQADARRFHQRERILSAAEQLLITHGVERSRLRDVAEAAGVSIGTVQHYFDTRARLVADLFEWSAARRLSAWLAAASIASDRGDPWTRLESLLHASLAEPLLWHGRIWVEFCAMARDEELRAKLGRFYDAWRPPLQDAIDRGVAAGTFRPSWPTMDIVDMLIMQVDGAELAIVLGAPGATPERLRRLLIETARAALGLDRDVTAMVANS